MLHVDIRNFASLKMKPGGGFTAAEVDSVLGPCAELLLIVNNDWTRVLAIHDTVCFSKGQTCKRFDTKVFLFVLDEIADKESQYIR